MPKDFDGTERRQYVRLVKDNLLRFRVLSDDKSNFLTDWIEAKTQNIGLGGMCINGVVLSDEIKNILLGKKRFIEIEMNLTPNDDKIQLNAEATLKVIAQKKWERATEVYEMGIQYLDPQPAVIDKIREFITKNYLEEYKRK